MIHKTDEELLHIMYDRLRSSYDQLEACRELEGREMRAYKGYGRKTLERTSVDGLIAMLENSEMNEDCRNHVEKELLRRSEAAA